MKTYLTTILLTLFASQVFAQHFEFFPSKFMSDTVYSGENSLQHMKVVPVDSQDVQVKWGLVTNTLDTGWSVSLCDYPACYFHIPDSGTMDPITATQLQTGLSPFFQLLVGANDSAGEAEVSLYVYDVSDPALVDTITFIVVNKGALPDTTDTSDVTGYATLGQESAFSLYPNPAGEAITVSATAIDEVQLFSISGALIRTYPAMGQTRMELDISDLAPGLYMVVTRSGDEAIRTKLLKQ